jgi:hypothetical protein
MDNQEKIDNDLAKVLSPEVEVDKNDGLKSLLEENLAMTKEIRAMVRHINVYVAWQRIFGWLKVFIILIPIVIGFIYLPPILSDAYQSFMKLVASGITA